jgi:hypothetical protein
MMQIAYSMLRGNVPRYLCGRARVLYATEQNRQSVGAHRLEQLILREVFAVLEPAALAATAQALAEAQAHHRARLAAFELGRATCPP